MKLSSKDLKYFLNEEIYRRSETDLIDKEFKVILDWFKNNNIKDYKKSNLDFRFATTLKNIENLILKLMNATVMLRFDMVSDPNKLDFGMCIYPSVQEMHNKAKDAIEKRKEGFYLRDCHSCLILIDLGLIEMLKRNNWNERYLTAVLLHELGHKCYVEQQDDIREGYSDGYVTLNLFGIKVKIPVGYLLPVIGFLLVFQKNINVYVDSEHLSDLTAVKYGYGKETYEIMNSFYEMSKFSSKLKIIENYLNNINTSKMRRDKIKKALEIELTDKNNSTTEKRIIRKTLDELKKIEEKSY
jgi:hypothetical protein